MQVCRNFIRSWESGSPFANAVLLFGRPGCGKTTLVRAFAGDLGWPLVETNASMDHGKKNLARMTDGMKSSSISGTPKIYFFDEVDNLNKRDQTTLLSMIGNSNDPVFLACNDVTKIDFKLKAACLAVEVAPPNKHRMRGVAEFIGKKEGLDDDVVMTAVENATSYRHLLNILESGGTITETDEGGSFDDHIRRRLQGKVSDIRPRDYWAVGMWLHDNTYGPAGGVWDAWLAKYRRVGKPMEKYALRVLDSVHVEHPEFPWSVMVKTDKKRKVTKVKQEETKPDPMGDFF